MNAVMVTGGLLRQRTLRFWPVFRQRGVEENKICRKLIHSVFWTSKEPFAEATGRPRTKAALVATRPVPSLTTSFDSSLESCSGRMKCRNMPSNAPPNMHTNRIEAITQSFTLDLSSWDSEFVTLRW